VPVSHSGAFLNSLLCFHPSLRNTRSEGFARSATHMQEYEADRHPQVANLEIT